ncbi:unnamed protein product [Medioppia subpectinata]|uniref:Ig-like domain-containing protein n=1 Tax=Medioppia subpectinata TaxID=1979941 RepID=A0A7R9KRR5_9ACAR|nr:unnamed protein product [Medioppia subpectinata]CAG2108332.1 unnamed protein product [Medioppia subpectinata]
MKFEVQALTVVSTSLIPLLSISLMKHKLLSTLLLKQHTDTTAGHPIVTMNVPKSVSEGSDVQLSCLHELYNTSLYSLKWFHRKDVYSEEREFFRYTPRAKQVKQVFPLQNINVNLYKSMGETVSLDKVSAKASGLYKCEITLTEISHKPWDEKYMTVSAANPLSQHIKETTIMKTYSNNNVANLFELYSRFYYTICIYIHSAPSHSSPAHLAPNL